MSEVKWTPDQQAAIDTHGCNLLVAAAAGSGKTAVLVERIIKMIINKDNPIDIDKLLVVTFTNAAASEMRERIAEAISKEIHKETNSAVLQRQLALLNKASITTIHSFCLQVIKNNFHQIDLDPGFRIGDETETVLLKQESLEEIFEEKYSKINDEFYEESSDSSNKCEIDEFLNLIESYCSNRDDSALQELVLNTFNFAMSMPQPQEWLLNAAEEFNIEEEYSFGDSKWAKILMDDIRIELEGMEKVMLRALTIINEVDELEPYYPMFIEEHGMIHDCLKGCETSWDSMLESFEDIKFGRLKTIKKCSDKAKQKIVKDIRDKVKKQLGDLQSQLLAANSDENLEDLRKMHYTIKALVKLVLEFAERYALKKKERGIIDFNDFEHFCFKILTYRDEEGRPILDDEGKYLPSKVAEELREKYDEILIDEYQDSNMVQEVLLNTISKEKEGYPNIFMVGDVKQSIYRFRQAKPELFLDKYNNYSKEEGELYRKITLYKNFRSREQVVDAVNFIFEQIMSESIGELDYTEDEALNLGADYKKSHEVDGIVGGDVELHLIEKEHNEVFEGDGKETSDDENEEELTNIELEARMAAERIKELMELKGEETYKVFDKYNKTYRPVEFRDIVVLLRSTAKWAPVFIEELKKYDIPVYADTGTGYFQTTEIQTMMSLLQIIDNPRQDIPLLSVMRSPIGGLTSEEFIDIRMMDKSATFYEAAIRAVDNGQLTVDGEKENNYEEKEELSRELEKTREQFEGTIQECDEFEENTLNIELAKKIKRFFEKLKIWREKSIHMPIDEFIWYLYMETGYYGFVGAMNAGVQRQANLRILFQRAREYEKTSYKGLFNFINFINKLKKNSGDMGSAKILGENENVVRIMSIHKSKGLEFPVVFVSGTGKQFNLMDLNKKILMHHELGFGPEYIDHIKRITYPTILKQAIKKKILLETLSEEMRILYVAFTRAREKLIITGTVKGIDKYCGKWSNNAGSEDEKIPEYDVLRGRSYLDWIVSAVIRHKDGKVLREAADIEEHVDYDKLLNSSKWHIKLWNRSDFEREKEMLEEKEEIDIILKLENIINKDNEESITEAAVIGGLEEKNELLDNDNKNMKDKYKKIVEKRLGYEYPFIKAVELPTAITVTELKRRINAQVEDDDVFSTQIYTPKLRKKPAFLEEIKGLSAAEKGTAMHDAMQYLDLSMVSSEEEVRKQIDVMVMKEMLTEEESKAIRIDKIIKFFNSPLGVRMLNVKEDVKREIPFSYEISCTEVYKELKDDRYNNEMIKLQGIIDCYFEENDKIILMDYKTDYVENGNVEPIIEKYKNQLDYYARALGFINHKEVTEKYLYLFGIDAAVKVK